MYPPISEAQRALLGRLVAQQRVSVEQLRDAGVPQMNRAELARWLDENVLGNQAGSTALIAIDALFEEDPTQYAFQTDSTRVPAA
jgi:hypothetical protein